ncbi:hypothetical protein BI364_12825 [Acidihalobacter yilgarnensis]|uniref:DUF1841 domain-containing protein n=1 Tax=Acidihalobacter yilgarnensis TaxID=2819280 RepID=A0A1D8IQE3_9GAMM|nr:DUF1841 family protein [Acidihalobacter yilgarnensis]AOU98728.1 hypothetical protein BI364_12825 [Acidihalobacter yilgarnensis]
MFGNDRGQIRRYYIETWQRHCRGEPLDALGLQIADVIAVHPEYHALFSPDTDVLERDYGPDDGMGNPFLHLGMHLAIREQVATDRPQGLAEVHRRLCLRLNDIHEAEHGLMECLGTALWEAQRSGRAPDETAYLECAQRLARST